MRHKTSTIVFAQGWLGGQIGSAVTAAEADKDENPSAAVVAAEVAGQWQIIDEALDDLIKENAELNRKLAVVQSALV